MRRRLVFKKPDKFSEPDLMHLATHIFTGEMKSITSKLRVAALRQL
jgi:hypothetical protein